MALVDDVLLALRNGQPSPADDRVWVLAEVNPVTKKWDWAVHNIAPAEASSAMFSVALSLHDRAREQEAQAAAPAAAPPRP